MLLGAMLLALAVVALAGVAAPRKADAATTVVTRTFDKTEQILFPAGANLAECGSGPEEGIAAPYPSQRRIAAFTRRSTIVDVDLVLRGFTHSFPDDVQVLLSKGGLDRLVMADVGGDEDVDGITLILNDEAATEMPNDDQLVGGSFKPTNPFGENTSLSAFDGLSPDGTWNLRVVDAEDGDCGELGGGWGLRIKARIPRLAREEEAILPAEGRGVKPPAPLPSHLFTNFSKGFVLGNSRWSRTRLPVRSPCHPNGGSLS